MDSEQKFSSITWLRSRTGLALLAFLAIAVFFLVTEHTAHFFGVLPFLLLLLCPLLHLFMHGGHSEHDGHANHQDEGAQGEKR
jgi:cbb3-type cytochrome oxidase subunit 3